MKKLFLFLAAGTFLLTSCSDNSSDNVNDDSNNNTDTAFESEILVNGQAFIPTPNTETLQTIMTDLTEGADNGVDNVRTFSMSNVAAHESIQLIVVYPAAQGSIDGTYSFSTEDIGVTGPYAQGNYIENSAFTFFNGGTVTVQDLGDNKFKLQFNNATAGDMFSGTVTNTITGSCQGTFTIMQE